MKIVANDTCERNFVFPASNGKWETTGFGREPMGGNRKLGCYFTEKPFLCAEGARDILVKTKNADGLYEHLARSEQFEEVEIGNEIPVYEATEQGFVKAMKQRTTRLWTCIKCGLSCGCYGDEKCPQCGTAQ